MRAFFELPAQPDIHTSYQAKAMRSILLLVIAIGILAPIIFETIDYLTAVNANLPRDFIAGFSVANASFFLFLILKQGLIKQATIGFLILTFAIVSGLVVVSEGVLDPLITVYFFLIAVAGLILGDRFAILMAILATVAMVLFYVTELNQWLNYPADRLSAPGEWLITPIAFFMTAFTLRFFTQNVDQREEQIRLGNEALKTLSAELENRISERTKALKLTIDVGRQLTSILDTRQLAKEVVELIHQSFNYYHVHIYLVDDAKQILNMAGGSGAAGKAMLSQGHALTFDQGIVGQVTRQKTSILIADVKQHDKWLSNPMLPETESELAVPILLGESLLGVLDVQHNINNGLSQSDEIILQAVANQLAVALRNAQIVARIRQQAQNETTINNINNKIQQAKDIDAVFEVVAHELDDVLNLQGTKIRLGKI